MADLYCLSDEWESEWEINTEYMTNARTSWQQLVRFSTLPANLTGKHKLSFFFYVTFQLSIQLVKLLKWLVNYAIYQPLWPMDKCSDLNELSLQGCTRFRKQVPCLYWLVGKNGVSENIQQ